MRELKAAGLQNEIDVFVDGGVRRGTDILKVGVWLATSTGEFVNVCEARVSFRFLCLCFCQVIRVNPWCF